MNRADYIKIQTSWLPKAPKTRLNGENISNTNDKESITSLWNLIALSVKNNKNTNIPIDKWRAENKFLKNEYRKQIYMKGY